MCIRDSYEAYLNYFLESQPDKIAVLRAQAKRAFRLNTFLNNPHIYPKQLRTYTVHQVIAQFLFFLEKGNHQQATDRVERLRGYANKQLTREGQFRMVHFIRLLQQLAKSDYDLRKMSNTEKYYDRLVATPFMYRGIIQELEIVPFEKLWNYILRRMKK